MSLLRICRKCSARHELAMFPKYGNHGKRRHECQNCVKQRMAAYARVRKDRPRIEPKRPPEKALPPPNFYLLYRSGTRCWCCRRNSVGQMLCRTCRGVAA